ncbi:hypothetical protein, partial [Mesorhizobium sp.]|uniref:hypothetical protein n=1 Tax=Mesorhizobium sp. TaxID=1871066 RepID=UPI0032AF5512
MSGTVKISAAHNSVGSDSSINCSQCGTGRFSLPDTAARCPVWTDYHAKTGEPSKTAPMSVLLKTAG